MQGLCSDSIRMEITPSAHKAGGWWCYIIQEIGGDRRTIGKAFQIKDEAWQWGQAFVERIRRC